MRNCYLFILSLCVLFTSNLVFAQQQQCEGVEILYPKTDSIIDRTVDQTSTYLILGNTAANNKNNLLKKVLLLHEKDGNEISKQVWIGQDELLKVSAIQQDLNKIEQDLPNTYWFRVFIQQNGHDCQYDSGKFKINSSKQ